MKIFDFKIPFTELKKVAHKKVIKEKPRFTQFAPLDYCWVISHWLKREVNPLDHGLLKKNSYYL